MSASSIPSFQAIYATYFSRVYRYCLRRVSNPQEAEDLTAEIFTRVLTNLSTYRGGSLPAWLFRIAHNAVVNHLRSRHTTVPIDEQPDYGAPGDVLEDLIDIEKREQVARLVAGLPDETREVLALKISGGLSAREIGQVLGKSEGAVRVMVHRVVQQLRMAWAKEQA